MDLCSFESSPVPTQALEDCAALKEYIRSHGKEAWVTVSAFSSFAKGNINFNTDDTNLHMCGWLEPDHDRLLGF